MFAGRPFLAKYNCWAEWGEAPSMYEMEGALPSYATPSPPVARQPRATRRPPVPDTRVKCRFPGASRVPGIPPDGSRFQR